MPENISSQFHRLFSAPIEDNRSVETILQRDSIPSNLRWEGMHVYVSQDGEKKTYELRGGLTNDFWEPISDIDIDVAVDIAFSTTSTNPVQNQVITNGMYQRTQLQNPGQAQVHWDNLTDVPDLVEQAELSDYQLRSEKGQANGYASLNASGVIPTTQLPPVAITQTHVVNSEAEMLALDAQTGDVAVRTDINNTFILQSEPASSLSNWVGLLTPGAPVQSVNGETGTVQLDPSFSGGQLSITGSNSVNLDSRYYTETETDGLLNDKADKITNINSGDGLTGGGNLTSDRIITLGTPGSITLSSTDSVTSTSHTHAFEPGGTSDQYIDGTGQLQSFEAPTWGEIQGNLEDQTDLQEEFDNLKFNSVDFFQRVIDLYDNNVISYDGTTENANELSAVTDNYGNVYLGKSTSKGDLVIVKFTPDGQKIERKIGDMCSTEYEMDSHTSPVILLDEREGAEYPIIIYQSNHSSTGCGMGVRQWRLQSLDIGEVEIPDPDINIAGTSNTTYPQFFRHGDEIYGFVRQTTANNNIWKALYSSDNGDTWISRNVFAAGGSTNWMYLYPTRINGTSKINLAFNDHIINGTNHSIRYLSLDMDTKILTNLGSYTVADFPDFIENSGAYINPYVVGLELYSPIGGETTNRIRVSQNESGNLIGIFQRSDAKILSGVEFDRDTGTIINVFDISSVTGEAEFTEFINYAENNMVYAFTWEKLYEADRIDLGNSSLIRYNISDINNITSDTLLSGNYKLHRPRKLPNGNGFSFCEMLYDRGFSDFKSNIIIHKFDSFVPDGINNHTTPTLDEVATSGNTTTETLNVGGINSSGNVNITGELEVGQVATFLDDIQVSGTTETGSLEVAGNTLVSGSLEVNGPTVVTDATGMNNPLTAGNLGFGLSWNSSTNQVDWSSQQSWGSTGQLHYIPTTSMNNRAFMLGDPNETGISPAIILDRGTSGADSQIILSPPGMSGLIGTNSISMIYDPSGDINHINLETTNIDFQLRDTVGGSDVYISATNGLYVDQYGINGSGNFSANYTSNSYVQKTYVDQAEYLKSLPNYNATVEQVLGHDVSGNLTWINN